MSEEKKGTPLARSRSWMLTLGQDYYDQETVERELANYTYAGQLEKGDKTNDVTQKQFVHWQIYIENPNPIKFDTLRNKFPKGHYETRWGTKQQALIM